MPCFSCRFLLLSTTVCNDYLKLSTTISWSILFYVGKRFGFAWGEGSKNYSEMVIRSYLCKHGEELRQPGNIGLYTLAAIHHSGSQIRMAAATEFTQMVRLAFNSKCLVS